MAATIERTRIDRLAVAFMLDHVGLDEASVARLLDVGPEGLAAILAGHGAPDASHHAVDGLAAIQSLLLSAYTPEGAARWMTGRAPELGMRVPAGILAGGAPDAVDEVLRAVVARVAS